MASAEAAPLFAMYDALASKVKELDGVLDAASDQKGAGRRAVINQLVSAQEGMVASVVAQFVDQLNNARGEDGTVLLDDNGENVPVPDERKYGIYFGVLRGLREAFDETGIAYAESLVEERPAVKVDPAEVEAANSERSDKVGQMKHLLAILEAVAPEEVAELKLKAPRRRSTGGPRGKRAISFYTWDIDGVPFEGNLTAVAKHLGYKRPADLRDEMKVEGADGKPTINLTKPPDVIEFTTSGGNVLVGTKMEDAPSWEDIPDEASDDDDDDDDDETTEEVSELANV